MVWGKEGVAGRRAWKEGGCDGKEVVVGRRAVWEGGHGGKADM